MGLHGSVARCVCDDKWRKWEYARVCNELELSGLGSGQRYMERNENCIDGNHQSLGRNYHLAQYMYISSEIRVASSNA